MQWIKASERLPENDKACFLKVNGVPSIGFYNKTEKGFMVIAGWYKDISEVEWLSESSPPCQCERYREVLEKLKSKFTINKK